jgi:predicted ester cyclase
MSVEENKLLVRRFVEQAVGQRNIDFLDELVADAFVPIARRWVSPFQSAFPDFEMQIVELIGEGQKVVGHFRCSGTHPGDWLGVPGTGHRFEDVDEIYVFEIESGKIVAAVGVEDNLSRMRQLGIGRLA